MPSVGSPGSTLGNGPVKVALLLPLSGPGPGAVVAQSLKNAADLAVSEGRGTDLTLLVKDDHGTPDGAREAASQALSEGAELVIGPLFAGSVQAAGPVLHQAGRPMIAFSSDASAAAPGTYLLSFLVQQEVDRIIAYAAQQGRRSIAALIPQTAYGSVVEGEFRQAAARQGMRVMAIEHYPAGQPNPAVQRLAGLIGGEAPQADLLFLPDSGDGLPAVSQSLQAIGFDPQKVKPIGTGLWNEARVFALPALQGGWFAAPDGRGFAAFAERYRGRFGTDPTRLASLSYDAVTLANALARTQGPRRFAAEILTNPSGFMGIDGIFRFEPGGTNARGLAVQEIRSGASVMADAAPHSFMASGLASAQ